MTKTKKVLTVIEQLGFGKEKDFRPFTKSELDERQTACPVHQCRNCGLKMFHPGGFAIEWACVWCGHIEWFAEWASQNVPPDPRSEDERDLDCLADDEAQTRESIRP